MSLRNSRCTERKHDERWNNGFSNGGTNNVPIQSNATMLNLIDRDCISRGLFSEAFLAFLV